MADTVSKKYSLWVATSMGIPLTPVDSQPFHCSDTFKMQATSAESNVASVAFYLGMPMKVLTAFVKESPVSHFIKDNIRSRGMDFEGAEFEQGDPWAIAARSIWRTADGTPADWALRTTRPVKSAGN